MIKCKICSEATHSIQLHLSKKHGSDSDHPISLEEYTEKWPDAPMMSDIAKKKLKERLDQKQSEGKVSDKPKFGEKAMMHEVFELGDAPAAKNARGNPIQITICQQTDYREMVPEIDPNYLWNIETLKIGLLGMEMNIPTYFFGASGTGKSSAFDQIAARTNRRLVRVQHSINTEESHIVGQWSVQKHKDEETGQVVAETVFELGPLPLAMINGWVYLADEYDRAHPSVLSVYQAVLEGKALYIKEADRDNRVIKPAPGFSFVATGNTNGAGDEMGTYAATVVQDSATMERFGLVEEVHYMSFSEEVAIVKAQARVIKADATKIVEFAKRVRERHPQEISIGLGVRVLINIAKIGNAKSDLKRGVELCYANRLPEIERKIVMDYAQHIFG